MSSLSSNPVRYSIKYVEICIGNVNHHTDPHALLNYFEKFGKIMNYNFTSPTGGYVFITYENSSMVDECMNARPHYIDNRHLYVKRALPIDDDHPRERFETTRDLMIIIDSNNKTFQSQQFLNELRAYFSSYGRLYACNYSHETNFDYILVEFADKDQVDRIILDKPHYYDTRELDVMKHLKSNIEIMNKKYSSNQQQSSVIKDAIDDDNHDFTNSQHSLHRNKEITKEPISEIDLQNEVYHLQDVLKKMNEDFSIKRRQLEEDCSEQLKQLHENADKTHHLQLELEEEHAKLSVEYESIKHENETLNEHYLAAELENFEISSYYEQILAEEKAQTAQLEAEYAQKLKALGINPSSPSSLVNTPSLTTTSPSQSTTSYDK